MDEALSGSHTSNTSVLTFWTCEAYFEMDAVAAIHMDGGNW
jgi:hypothetical protein